MPLHFLTHTRSLGSLRNYLHGTTKPILDFTKQPRALRFIRLSKKHSSLPQSKKILTSAKTTTMATTVPAPIPVPAALASLTPRLARSLVQLLFPGAGTTAFLPSVVVMMFQNPLGVATVPA